jgi:hypothetical protein
MGNCVMAIFFMHRGLRLPIFTNEVSSIRVQDGFENTGWDSN